MITTIPRIAHLPQAKPQWCWCESVDSTNVHVRWSDRSSDEDLFDLERSEDLQTWTPIITNLPSDSKERNHTNWFRYSTFLAKGDAVPTNEHPNYDNSVGYVDTTAQPDTVYYYRVRAKKTGGVDVSGWSRSWNYAVTPPDNVLPARVRLEVTTQPPRPSGTVHTPQNTSELSTLLDTVAFSRGDVIQLRHDVDYGPAVFRFPKLSTPLTGNRDLDYVLVRSDNWQQLPGRDERVSRGDADNMPKCFANTANNPVFGLAKGASHYWFLGIHFDRGAASTRSNGLFDCYEITTTEHDLDVTNNEPETFINDIMNHHIGIDRCYFYGGAEDEQQGMAIHVNNSHNLVVCNCLMENFKQGSEKQTILISGGFKLLIQNNWLASGSAMSLFTWAGRAPGFQPQDVRIHRNVLGLLPKYDERSFSFDFDNPGGGVTWTDVEIDASDARKINRTGFAAFNNITRYHDVIRINSGTGFVPGRYKIHAQDSPTAAVILKLDRPAGVPGSTGGSATKSSSWVVKNSFEAKRSERLEFTENLFLSMPEVGQPGQPFIFGPRVTGKAWDRSYWGKAAHDITIRWNYVTKHEGPIVIQVDDRQGSEAAATTLGARRILFENNLFEDTLPSNESLFLIENTTGTHFWNGITLRHNTFVAQENPPDPDWNRDSHSDGVFQWISGIDSVVSGSIVGNVFTIGLRGSRRLGGSSDLATSLDEVLGTAVEVRDNVWMDVDNKAPGIPLNDVSAPDFDAVFVDWRGKDFRIKPAFQGVVSPPVLRGQTNPGCDIDELRRRLRGVYDGKPAKQVVAVA